MKGSLLGEGPAAFLTGWSTLAFGCAGFKRRENREEGTYFFFAWRGSFVLAQAGLTGEQNLNRSQQGMRPSHGFLYCRAARFARCRASGWRNDPAAQDPLGAEAPECDGVRLSTSSRDFLRFAGQFGLFA